MREKQIEEIAKILLIDCEGACTDCEYYGRYDGSLCIPMRLANELYNAGYRKQSEGEWILHKPRRENRNATYKCSACGKLCSSYYNDVGAWKCCPYCGAKMKGANDE